MTKELNKTNEEDHRPWGYYVVLSDEVNHKIKRIVVYPNKRLSLQRHLHRHEHWYIIYGKAIVTLGNKQISLKAGSSIDIPTGTVHRIENISKKDMIFIEIQRGTYFGEDDIERLEDDFGRV
ncbi:MAG: phosphomannose isomerase type II C-terminal cupin domain [bacterium]|nr:phosphomannose isomerase type II C-terminal cupin domain [bacterium]